MAVVWEDEVVTWEDSSEVTGAFKGITTPVADLYAQIHTRGWQVTDVSYKDGAFQATAKNPYGETVTKVGRDEPTALAAALLHIVRKEFVRQGSTQSWVDQLEPIANAYAKAPLFDPKAAPAWKELADDCVARAQALGNQLQIEVVDDPNPYHSPQDLWDDVRNKQHLFVSRHSADHPLWTEDQVIAFRICHDVLGHAAGGGDFGWTGENLATAAHAPWLSPNAQRALFAETIGQSAYREHYRGYGPTKVTFLDDHFKGPEDGPMGLPPQDTIAPQNLPERKTSKSVLTAFDVRTNATKVAGIKRDPNFTYETGITQPVLDARNGYMDSETGQVVEPDPLNIPSLDPHIDNLGCQWSTWLDQNGEKDLPRMKAAIINSARAAILSSQKELYDNAIQYQDVMHLPPDDDDPMHYWTALTSRRLQWNDAQNVRDVEMQHKEWFREGALHSLWVHMRNTNPHMDPAALKQAVERTLMYITADCEAKARNEAKDGDRWDVLEPKVDKLVEKAIREITQVQRPNSDKSKGPIVPKSWDPSGWRQENPEPYLPIEQTETTKNQWKRYPGFMATSCIAMARVSQHAQELLEAALQDMKPRAWGGDNGGGRIFRAACLNLKIPYFGVKIITWTWMMLSPHSCQMATVDRHIAEMLGMKTGKGGGLPNREYFLAERQLEATRDALGYQDVPLGKFQWAIWDVKRNGPGAPHQDHSAFRPENPRFYEMPGSDEQKALWLPKPAEIRALKGKNWVNDIAPTTMPYFVHPDIQAVRDQVTQDWEQEVLPKYRGKNNIPWSEEEVQTNAPTQAPQVFSASKSEMHLALDVPERIRWRIHEFFHSLDLPNSKPLDPEEYHITVAYANSGADNPALDRVLNRWNLSGMKFDAKKLSVFGPEDALVLELSSPAFKDAANAINDWLEEEGIEVSRHEGGFKPHITLAYGVSTPPRASLPPISFRSDGMSFSVPRGQDIIPPIWARMSPLEAALSGSRPNPVSQDPQNVQRLTKALNAPKKFSARHPGTHNYNNIRAPYEPHKLGKARQYLTGKKIQWTKMADEDYRVQHTAPQGPDSVGLHELDKLASDFYQFPEYYMHGEEHYPESVRAALAARGNPEAMVTIHRATPHGVINPGDWVTLAPSYAKAHGMHHSDPELDMPVASMQVPARHVRWDGNDVNEFGYDPS